MQHSGVRRTGRVTELEGHGSAARTLSVGDRALRWVSTRRVCSSSSPDEQPPAPHGAVVRRFETAPGRLVLEVDAPAGATTALIAPGQTVPGTPDGSQWVFELTTDPWGLGPAPAPTGGYRLVRHRRRDRAAGDPRGRGVRPAAVHRDRRAASQGPVARPARWARAAARSRRSTTRRPGRGRSTSSSGSYRAVSEPLDSRLVYFQSFLGQSPTDHPAAIQAELHRVLGERGRPACGCCGPSRTPRRASRTGPSRCCSAAGSGTTPWRAPPGWSPTSSSIRGSPVARGRRCCETYHGYPSKAMGLSQWRARGLTPTHQSADAAAYLRLLEQPAHPDPGDGPLLPRELRVRRVGSSRRATRATTRSSPRATRSVAPRPGSGSASRPHQKAVLYAPTWRDDLATNFRSAQAVLHLSVDRAARGARTRLRDPAPRAPLPLAAPATVRRSSTSPATPRSTT